MPEIAFIMGKSCSGKDKIFKALADDKSLGLKTVTMYTTRPMRKGETQGVEYYFVDAAEADRMAAEGRIIERRTYNTMQGLWQYFMADDGQIVLGQGKYLVIGTLEAYQRFTEYFGKQHLLPIYIEVEDGLRLMRALHREGKQQAPDYAELCRRFLADNEDFSRDNIVKCGITHIYYNNGDINDCIAEIKEDIRRLCG